MKQRTVFLASAMAGWVWILSVPAQKVANPALPGAVVESARGIPLAYDVDVVVVGGTSRGVAAAVAAAGQGAKVFLAAPYPYLGEDLCGSGYLWLEEGEKPGDPLSRAIYRQSGSSAPGSLRFSYAATPMQVKRALDDALLVAGVDFLYGCHASDLLYDPEGQVAGIVMVNRSGRQAVRAKVVVDATDRAAAVRMTQAVFSPYAAGNQPFKRLVLGGTPGPDAVALDVEYVVRTSQFEKEDRAVTVYEYSLDLPMEDGSWASFARADQEARNRTWQEGQLGASEMLFQVPPDPVRGRKRHAGCRPDAGQIDLDALRPHGVDGVYVLGGCADVSREAAARLMRPVNGIPLGTRVGIAAAAEAGSRSMPPLDKLVVGGAARCAADGRYEIGEILNGLRSSAPLEKGRHVGSPAREIPVLGQYDVVVVGGGTGGAPAGIAAARHGAKTLVLEALHGLGGVGTLGRITRYWHGNRVGFTAEIDHAMGGGRDWDVEKRMEWFRREIVAAGGEVWFHSSGCGAVMDGRRVAGVVVATPFGRGIVLAGSVVDSTGNAVIPSCAGAPFADVDGEHISVQGTGLPPYTPGRTYLNTDWCFSDDNDVVDMWRMFVVAKQKYMEAFDLGQLVDTRVRRRIIGDVVVSPMDILNERLYPDVITVAKSNFDNHGFSSHALFMVTPPDKRSLTGNIPYRALLPKGHDGILVTGLGISAHGDALPVLRMQPDVQNQGYAAGLAAALAAEKGTTVRMVDVKELQRRLVEKGIIPASMLTAEDSYPIGPERMETAVRRLGEDYSGISLVLADPDMALPRLREAWRAAGAPEQKLRYAHVLGMLYDAAGVETLIDAVANAEWDEGWNFRGMGQFGASSSPLDNLVVALGRTGDLRGVPVVLDKLSRLDARSAFSHCRAVAIALENFNDPRAAEPLARLLREDGMQGHALVEISEAIRRTPPARNDNTTRQHSLRELILARALFRCGDLDGMGENILRQYAEDYRGVYSRHAKAVLEERNPPTTRKEKQ